VIPNMLCTTSSMIVIVGVFQFWSCEKVVNTNLQLKSLEPNEEFVIQKINVAT